ncbi:hypothetical protein QFZ75_008082 [Streptomyces sp. V3I8]|uniref:hypothetical protein n=1 Tax=Streptomyces sp. V3I8 TaxID=3042279 RepID=UPI002787060A|nr:hypothetical protein [Streptomyces sp. V3I8]MDQ1041580.1 hypothetical protein [Streptomyces sp. V3I8]
MYDNVDEDLAQGIGPAAAQALSEYAALHHRHYRLVRWLVNGRSRAPVAVVRETDRHEDKTTKLILKVPAQDGEKLRLNEFARHRAAIKQAPAFAAAHLSKTAHPPIRVGDGSWITFQRVAGRTLEDTEVLTVLLFRMLDRSSTAESGPEPVSCDSPTFTNACATVVAGVLGEWAEHPDMDEHAPMMSVADFLTLHLAGQFEPGGRLHPYAQLHQGDMLHSEPDGRPLPNPLAIAQGRCFSDVGLIQPLLGKTHGDLHTDNALIRVRPAIDSRDYHLIDNALYEERGPLTRDPVHLLFYIVARTMDELSLPQQNALIDLLIAPSSGPGHRLPGWLTDVVKAVDAACLAWVEDSGLAPEWRAQTLLSLLACALMFVGRKSIREEDRKWFLRLAGRAAERFQQLNPAVSRDPAQTAPDPALAAGRTGWIGRMCRDLPEVAAVVSRASARDRSRENGAATLADQVEDLRTAALGGLDRAADYRDLTRHIGGPDDDTRFGTEGRDGTPVTDEWYVCPMDLCDRRDGREPGEPLPVCHLSRTQPQRLKPERR